MNKNVLDTDLSGKVAVVTGAGGVLCSAFAKTLARQERCDGLELQVNARNQAAYAMYRHCGFTEKSINMELL